MQHPERRLAQCLGDRELVHLFIVALLQIDDLAFRRSADQDHRKAVGRRVGQRDQAIQEAWRRNRQANARRLGQIAGDRRRVAGVLLMPEGNHPHARCLRQAAQIGNGNARNAVDRLDAIQHQRVDDKMEAVGHFDLGNSLFGSGHQAIRPMPRLLVTSRFAAAIWFSGLGPALAGGIADMVTFLPFRFLSNPNWSGQQPVGPGNRRGVGHGPPNPAYVHVPTFPQAVHRATAMPR